jgi:hypothetical protein
MKTYMKDLWRTGNLVFFACVHFAMALYFQIRYDVIDTRVAMYYVCFIILIAACAIKEEMKGEK